MNKKEDSVFFCFVWVLNLTWFLSNFISCGLPKKKHYSLIDLMPSRIVCFHHLLVWCLDLSIGVAQCVPISGQCLPWILSYTHTLLPLSSTFAGSGWGSCGHYVYFHDSEYVALSFMLKG